MEKQLKQIDKFNVKIKNLLGLIDEPTYEDLLFEIVQLLEEEQQYDGVFKKKDIQQKTRCRISGNLESDLSELEKLGYIENIKYTRYRIIKHPWEINDGKN